MTTVKFQQVDEWYEHFKNSGEIPVSDVKDDFEWIEDNCNLIFDWIINTYIPENGYGDIVLKEHLDILSKILKMFNTNEYDDIINSIQKRIIIIEKPNEKRDNAIKYSKEYREANQQKIKEKRSQYYVLRKDKILGNKILDNLNSGITRKPRPSTMKKYNLHYDGEKWTIDKNMRNDI